MGAILGVSVAIWGVIMLVVGLLALFDKKLGAGDAIRGLIGSVPIIGKMAQLVAIIFIIVGLSLGGLGTSMAFFTGAVSTASLGGDDADPMMSSLTCEFTVPINATVANMSFKADKTDRSKYQANVQHDSGADSISGTLRCIDNRADISKGVSHTIAVKGGSFKNEVSTTDSNTYYILATSTTASKVPGLTWAQTAYLADSGSSDTDATTSGSQEEVELVFAQDEKVQYLGYYLTLPGDTVFAYLDNSTSVDVDFTSDGSGIAQLTVEKVASA